MTLSPIISLEELRELIATKPVVILDARQGEAAYAAGHLHGAIHADVERDLSTAGDPGFDPAAEGRHPLPPLERWAKKLGAWGIGPETDVVIYDDANGANAASRAWWMLRASGHQRVRVLDASLAESRTAGLDVDTNPPVITPRAAYPAAGWSWPTVDIGDVDHLRNDPSWRVLDVRSAPRFRGETEPIDPVAGHIPGAVNLPFAENLVNGHWKSRDELRRQYDALLGPIPPEHLVVHCGSGVTACHTLLALELAGLEGASLFVGSWSQWCRSDREVGKGES